MYLLSKLILNNLNENFISKHDDKIIQTFYLNTKTYSLTESHLRFLKSYLKSEIDKRFVIEDEKFSIAGGSVLTLMMYSNPFLIKDIDIFPCSQNDFDKLKTKLDSAIKQFAGTTGTTGERVFENENSISYSFLSIKIDLVKKFYPTTLSCIENFDLSPAQMGFDQDFKFTSLTNLNEIFNFQMNIVKEITPENAFALLRRTMKYCCKGFRIDPNVLAELYAVIKSNESKLAPLPPHDEDTLLWTVRSNNPGYLKCFQEAREEQNKGYHNLLDSKSKSEF